ncbi:hypothetical protein A0H81_03942 [Grifola frondosa]|uniref:Uncharacterized protein n=1 Tax=Grifola frondosa TaxID=5627 RepID=A0A1C7MIK4_GRIFR|nr:hypothetical protein A0H81_03942 [Grifola frondosa]
MIRPKSMSPNAATETSCDPSVEGLPCGGLPTDIFRGGVVRLNALREHAHHWILCEKGEAVVEEDYSSMAHVVIVLECARAMGRT